MKDTHTRRTTGHLGWTALTGLVRGAATAIGAALASTIIWWLRND